MGNVPEVLHVPSPARRAIGMAAFVIAVALALYLTAATLDRWPALVLAAWGAALGAGMAINGIAFRETDFGATGDSVPGRSGDWRAAIQHQVYTALVAVAAWQTAATESIGWAAAGALFGVAWARTVPRLVAGVEQASAGDVTHAYFRAFQLLAIVIAVSLMYGSVSLETPWLLRPAVPADLQGFVWLAILEFAGLPLTLIAVRGGR